MSLEKLTQTLEGYERWLVISYEHLNNESKHLADQLLQSISSNRNKLLVKQTREDTTPL